MRQRLFIVASAIAGAAQILITILGFAIWLGVLVWLARGGNLLAVALWFPIGAAAVTLLSSLVLLPFILLALGIAALTGRFQEKRDGSALDDR